MELFFILARVTGVVTGFILLSRQQLCISHGILSGQAWTEISTQGLLVHPYLGYLFV